VSKIIDLTEQLKKGEDTPFYSAVVVVNKEKTHFLMGKRKEDDIYTSPAGGANLGETPKQTAIREAYEEANLRLTPGMLKELPITNLKNGKVCHCFVAVLKDDQKIGVQHDPDKEVWRWRWYPIEKRLPEPMCENRQKSFLEAKMRLMGLKKANTLELPHILEKGKKAPVGTISPDGKYIKVGAGDWRRVNGHHYKVTVTIKYNGNRTSQKEFIVQARTFDSAWGQVHDKIKAAEKLAGPVQITSRSVQKIKALKKSLGESELSGVNIDTTNHAIEVDAMKESPWLEYLDNCLKDFELAEVPREVPLDRPWVLIASQVDDGIYDGYVKNMDEYSGDYGQVVFQVKKMTLPAMTSALMAKNFISKPKEEAKEEGPREEQDAHGVSELKEILQTAKIQGDLNIYIQKSEQSEKKKLIELLNKAKKPMPVGTMRVWSGRKYVKHVDGWVAVGGAHHGKLLGQFKKEPTHTEHADEHKGHDFTKPEAPKKEAPKPKEEPKKLPSELEYKYKAAVKVYGNEAIDHTKMSVKEYQEAMLQQLIKDRPQSADYFNRKKRTYNKRFKDVHHLLNKTALKAGLPVSDKALKEYPELSGDIAEGVDLKTNEKTNMIGSVDLGKSSKKVKESFKKTLNECNLLIEDMGIKFKTPINFKAVNLAKTGKTTRGTYSHSTKTIALKDVSAASKTVMHEIGHAIDYAMTEKDRRGRHGEMLKEAKFAENPTELQKLYVEMHDIVTGSDYYTQTEERSFKRYLLEPTEVFARAFEVYSLDRAEKMKLSKEFMDTFMPDVMKVKDPKVKAIREKISDISQKLYGTGGKAGKTGDLLDERTKLYAQLSGALEKTTGGWVPVSDSRSKEYKSKIVKIMDQIFAKDEIKKALSLIDLNEALIQANSAPVRIMLIQGGARSENSCPGEDSKGKLLVEALRKAAPEGLEIDVLDLEVTDKDRIIRNCKNCVGTANGYHCHWKCSCYGPGSAGEKLGDIMHDEKVYDRLERADGFIVLSPTNWGSVTSSLKAMFDRLVCANLTLTQKQAKELFDGDIKNPEKTQAAHKEGKYDHMLKNHLENRVAGFYMWGVGGGNDYAKRPLPKSMEGFEYTWNEPNSSVSDLVDQCRYSGIFVPEDLIKSMVKNTEEDYSTIDDRFRNDPYYVAVAKDMLWKMVSYIKRVRVTGELQ